MNELRDKEGRTPGQVVYESVSSTSLWAISSDRVKQFWEKAAQAILTALGAQVSRWAIIDAWRAGWDAVDFGQHDPATYADNINLTPERAPLPYSAEEVTDAVVAAWCNPDGVQPPPKRAYSYRYKAAVIAAAKFCAPCAEPKTSVTTYFTAESQQYPAPEGFSAWPNPPAEPTLDDIRALAAKHGMVLTPVLRPLSRDAQNARKPLPPDVLADALQDAVHKEVGKTRPAKTARSLAAKLTAPDPRFGDGKSCA